MLSLIYYLVSQIVVHLGNSGSKPLNFTPVFFFSIMQIYLLNLIFSLLMSIYIMIKFLKSS